VAVIRGRIVDTPKIMLGLRVLDKHSGSRGGGIKHRTGV